MLPILSLQSFLLLHILSVALLIAHPFPAAQDQQCHTATNGEEKCGQAVLPKGVCLWRQGNIHEKLLTGASRPGCNFQLRDAEFLDVIGTDPQLDFVAAADAHEGGVYFPDKEEFYFSSTRVSEPKPNIKLMKISLVTKNVSTVLAQTNMANGMVLDKTGSLLVCEQGLGSEAGFIQRIDLLSLRTSVIADNWFGRPFNSPNDVVVKSDGSIWFTDPDYAWVQGFKNISPSVSNQVYRISPSGVVDSVADGFEKPNGLAFSQDEKLLYVTDTGSSVGDGTFDVFKPHCITAFEVSENGERLSNRRLFASIASLDGSYEGIGVPDGIKVDKKGRVYAANSDGVQVFNAEGKLLGLIRVPGAANMGFVGKKLDRMLILNDTAIHSVHLRAQGAGLFYAEEHSSR